MLRCRVLLVVVTALAVVSLHGPSVGAVTHNGLFTIGITRQTPGDPVSNEKPGQPIIGDFNGDGRADILWYVAGPRGDELFLGAVKGVLMGQGVAIYGHYEPVVGDF